MKEQSTETTRRILDAATEVFAEVGFSGARVDEIAKRAGINKAALYYHIGSKEVLYAEVLRNLIGDAADQAIKNIEDTDSPEEKLKIYIDNIARLVDQNSYVAPIMLRELASGGQHMSEYVVQTLLLLVRALIVILKEGEEQGIFTNNLSIGM